MIKKANVYSEQIFRTNFRISIDNQTNVWYYYHEQTFEVINFLRRDIMKKSLKVFCIFNKVVNNKLMLTVITLILLIILSLLFISKTEADSSKDYEKSFITIEIDNGDTLSSIAEEYAISPSNYKDYIEEVKLINNLKDDNIHYGCYLLIPVYN